MAKFHKIGTNIKSYIEDIRGYEVSSRFIPSNVYTKGSTSTQKLEILVTLHLLESFDDVYYESKSELYNGNYIVKPNTDECIIKNLIDAFDTIIKYESSLNNSDNDLERQKDFFKYKDEIDNIKSFAGSIVYFNYDKQLAQRYFDDDISSKDFKYFYIPSLNSDELISKALKIISPTTIYNYKYLDEQSNESVVSDGINEVLLLDTSASIDITSKVFRYNTLLEFFISDTDFKVPIYQRDYIWSQTSISNLFNSILEDQNAINIGTIVFHKREGAMFRDLYTIIDGQQRVTSLFIMLRAIHLIALEKSAKLESEYTFKGVRAIWNEKERIDSLLKTLNYKYFAKKNDESTIIGNSFDRIQGDDSYQAFRDLLNLTENRKSTCNNIDYNLQAIKEKLENLFIEKGADGIIEFANKLLNNVFVTVNIDKQTDELHLFEILNTTSVELSTLDLMKSYYISLIKDDQIEKHENEIQSLFYEKIMSKIITNKLGIDEFIRVILRYNLQYSKNYRTLFDNFKIENSYTRGSYNFEEVKNLILVLEEYLDIYLYIKKIQISSKFKQYKLEDFLDTLNRDIYYPILMHFIKLIENDKVNYNNARECLFEIEKFEIIFQICNYRGQSLSVQTDNVLKEIKEYEGDIDNIKIRDILNNIPIFSTSLNISKNNFRSRILEMDFSQKLATKVLSRIVHYKKNMHKITIMDTDFVDVVDQVSAEHIFPKDPLKWGKKKSDYVDLYQKIGNYAVINKKDNSKLSNKPFYQKMEHLNKLTYLSSDLTLNNDKNDNGFEVLSLDHWDKKEIIQRSEYLTVLCTEIWIGNDE